MEPEHSTALAYRSQPGSALARRARSDRSISICRMRRSRAASRARRVAAEPAPDEPRRPRVSCAARLLGPLGDPQAQLVRLGLHRAHPVADALGLPSPVLLAPARERRPARSRGARAPGSRRGRGRLGRHGGDGAHARLVAERPDAVEVLVRVDAGGRVRRGGRGVVGRSGRDAEEGRQAEAQGQHGRAECHGTSPFRERGGKAAREAGETLAAAARASQGERRGHLVNSPFRARP